MINVSKSNIIGIDLLNASPCFLLYQGPVTDVAASFARAGHPLPPNYNPADWILEVAHRGPEACDPLSPGPPDPPPDPPDDPQATAAADTKLGRPGAAANADEWRHVSFGTEVRRLFRREIVHTLRNKKGVGARFAFTTFLSTLVGSIFFQVGQPDAYGQVDPAVSAI